MKHNQIWICILILSIILSCSKDDDSPPLPIADFEISNKLPEVFDEIILINKSQNSTSFEWDFGDGTLSTEAAPTHVYQEGGTFTIKLTARGEDMTSSTSKDIDILIPINIFPGKGIKDINLGELWGSVKNIDGYDFTELGPVLTGNGWFHPVEDEAKGVFFIIVGSGPSKNDSDQIGVISLSSPFIGKTEKDISIGSTIAQVKSAYGDETEISNGNYEYNNLGISFGVTDSKVDGMIIFFP